MGHVARLTCHSFFAAALLCAGVASAAEVHAAAHNASARPLASAARCMNNSRPVSRVAYLPGGPDQAMQCGHLLSTDTLLEVHHWDKT